MPIQAEAIKGRIGDPFRIREKLPLLAERGAESLTPEDLFLLKWLGLYPHRTEPGFFMLRLKIPGGILTAGALNAIAKITAEQNRGFGDITTRQDIQLHWVKDRDVPAILETLHSVGVPTLGACGDILRNVVGCSVAGLDAEEHFDASQVLREVSDHFLGNPAYANLPRKYKISISGCKQQCTQPEIHCVSFTGMVRKHLTGEEAGFDLRVGGGLSTKWYFGQRLHLFVRSEQVLPVCKAITEIWRDSPEYRKARSHARLKFLIADWGVERFRAVLQERLGFALEEALDAQDPDHIEQDHVGVHEQKTSGLFYVGLPVPTGRISADQMKKAADLAERWGDGTLRLTVRQNLILVNVPQERVAQVLEGCAAVGLRVEASRLRRGIIACTGIEFCNLAITETKARAKEILEYLEPRVLLEEPLRLHVSGCPNTCAQSPIAHIGLQGSKTKVGEQWVEAFDVAIGGQLGRSRAFNHFVIRKIPASEVKFRLERLLIEYKRARKQGEFFNDFCRRVGDEAVAKLLGEEEKA